MSDFDDRTSLSGHASGLPIVGDRIADDRIAADPPPVCQSIRTKMQYVTPGHPDGWARVSATAGYWCLHTMSPVGPDDQQATPRGCRPGRACYESDD